MRTKYSRIISSITALISLFCITSLLQAKDEDPAEKAVATVNGAILTETDLSREIEGVRQQAARRGEVLDESRITKIKYDILESLIDQELLYQESKKKGIKVNEGLIKKEWDKITGQFPNETELNKALKGMNLTEPIIKKQIERGLSINQLISEQVAYKVKISADDAKEYYDKNPQAFREPEEVKASHILIKVEPNTDQAQKDAALEKIKDLQNKLKDGEDFASLAKEFSEGPSKTNGGDLGSFKRGQMVKPFEDAAFTMEPGEISDVVETRFGYHLIKVVEKKPEILINFEEVKVRLENFLRQGKTQEELKIYLAELGKGAKIERFLLNQNE
ncbi:peptidylprolyl isomerase [Thermodesulfobacteriota bacterium]